MKDRSEPSPTGIPAAACGAVGAIVLLLAVACSETEAERPPTTDPSSYVTSFAPPRAQPEPPSVTFTDVTADSGVGFVHVSGAFGSKYLPETMGAGVTVLDYTDPDRPRYASHNGDREQNPGSVGKIMVLLAWFQALRDIYGDDVAARQRLLLEAEITADAFIRKDSHKVPKWTWGMGSVDRVPIEEGDTANIYTFLDWMASASSRSPCCSFQSARRCCFRRRRRWSATRRRMARRA